MRLNPISSNLKLMTMLILFMLSAPFIRSQDTISVNGATAAPTAFAEVGSLTSFTLLPTAANAVAGAATVWHIIEVVPGSMVIGDILIPVGAPATFAAGPPLDLTVGPLGTITNVTFGAGLVGRTLTIRATHANGSVSISVTLVACGSLLKTDLTLAYAKDAAVVTFDSTGKPVRTYSNVTELDLVKGETANEGEDLYVLFYLPTTS